MTVRLEDLGAAFLGLFPATISTCDREGVPNVTYLSQIWYIDSTHVALSCQFFNKTRRNVDENPYATVQFYDPRGYVAYRMELRFDHLEKTGPLFDTMAARIQVIASHTGMSGIFRLLSADVYEVLAIERIDGFRDCEVGLSQEEIQAIFAAPPSSLPPALLELRGLQTVSERIVRAGNLEELLGGALEALDQVFRFSHSMVLVPDESGKRLVAIASRGYGPEKLGGEIAIGAGVFGTAAEHRRMVSVAAVAGDLVYGRAVRESYAASGGRSLTPELPLPGLPDAQAQLALPLLVGDRLVGVLGVESRNPLAFDEWDEAFLQIVANQVAMGIDRMHEEDDDEAEAGSAPGTPAAKPAACGRRLRFVYYRNDEVVFVDDEYLVRNVPAKIFWKILGQHQREGRTEFSNRELRLDDSLGLPGFKDNLESRLILLRKRLVEKCPLIRMVPVRRGRFALEVASDVEMVEKDSG